MDQQKLLDELGRLRAYANAATDIHLNAPEVSKGFYISKFKQVVHTLDRLITELVDENNADVHHADIS